MSYSYSDYVENDRHSENDKFFRLQKDIDIDIRDRSHCLSGKVNSMNDQNATYGKLSSCDRNLTYSPETSGLDNEERINPYLHLKSSTSPIYTQYSRDFRRESNLRHEKEIIYAADSRHDNMIPEKFRGRLGDYVIPQFERLNPETAFRVPIDMRPISFNEYREENRRLIAENTSINKIASPYMFETTIYKTQEPLSQTRPLSREYLRNDYEETQDKIYADRLSELDYTKNHESDSWTRKAIEDEYGRTTLQKKDFEQNNYFFKSQYHLDDATLTNPTYEENRFKNYDSQLYNRHLKKNSTNTYHYQEIRPMETDQFFGHNRELEHYWNRIDSPDHERIFERTLQSNHGKELLKNFDRSKELTLDRNRESISIRNLERDYSRERSYEKERSHSRNRSLEEFRNRSRERSLERDRNPLRSRTYEKNRERTKEKDSIRKTDRSIERIKESSGERGNLRDHEHQRERVREREKERDKEREKEREKERDKERDRERDKERQREKDCERDFDHENQKVKLMNREKEKVEEKHRSRSSRKSSSELEKSRSLILHREDLKTENSNVYLKSQNEDMIKVAKQKDHNKTSVGKGLIHLKDLALKGDEITLSVLSSMNKFEVHTEEEAHVAFHLLEKLSETLYKYQLNTINKVEQEVITAR